MGLEQGGLAAAEADPLLGQPWRRGEPRTPGSPLRVVLVPRRDGRAPDPADLAQSGIALHEAHVDLSALPENAPLLADADALVVEIDPADGAQMETFDRLIHLAGADLAVVAAVENLTVAGTRELLKAGAADVLPLGFTAAELRHAVEPARRPVRPATRAAAPQRRHGKTIAFVGALGGVGTSSIATQLGLVWAQSSRVGLIDLDIQFGAAALFLDLRASMGVYNLMEDADRLDAELLQSVAVGHASGLEVVAAPADMMPVDAISSDFVDQLLRTATQAYDVVLVDLPTVWTDWTMRVLQRADVILLVSNLTVPGIYQTRRQLEVLDANGLMGKLQLLANRVPHGLFRQKVDLKEPESVLGRRIDHVVANDYPGMSAANDEGKALKDVQSSARLLKDIKQLAARLSETIAAEAGPA